MWFYEDNRLKQIQYNFLDELASSISVENKETENLCFRILYAMRKIEENSELITFLEKKGLINDDIKDEIINYFMDSFTKDAPENIPDIKPTEENLDKILVDYRVRLEDFNKKQCKALTTCESNPAPAMGQDVCGGNDEI